MGDKGRNVIAGLDDLVLQGDRGEALRIVIRTVDRGFTYDFTRRAMMKVERVPLGPASVLAPKASAAR